MSNVVTDGTGSIGPDFVFHIPDTYPDHPISIGNPERRCTAAVWRCDR